jgi:vesicle coat complex subunit
MDNAVVYDEVNHAYYINGKKMAHSVTGVVESCFEKFNPQVVAERMIQGSNWPRAGYMQQDGKTPMTLEEILKKWCVVRTSVQLH